MSTNPSADFRTKSLRILSEGFKKDFAKYVYEDDRFTELLMELTSDFIIENIPLVDDDYRFELAMMLMETINVVPR